MIIRTLAALAAALSLAAAAHAQTIPPPAPTATELAALCDTCAVVTATKSERRKGKATVAGTAGGAVVGGVVGRKVGDGGVVATGVGAVAGAAIGREIEKQARRYRVWVTTVQTKDGKSQTLEATADPGVKVGDRVRIEGGLIVR